MREDDASLASVRAKIAQLGALLYSRHLTDSAGGNISARVGDVYCITPRFSGSRDHWLLRPEQVLVVDKEGRVIEGEGDPSREMRVHLESYARVPQGSAIIHAHPVHVLAICALGRNLPPTTEAGLKHGEIELVEWAPAHSAELAERVSKALERRSSLVGAYAGAALARWHGIFVMGRDLDSAFDVVERAERSATCYLEMLGVLGSRAAVESMSEEIVRVVRRRKDVDGRCSTRQIVTITPNTTLDRVLFIPRFGWGKSIRADASVVSTGGKPEDVSFILGELGTPSLALGFAAGMAGHQMERMMQEKGVSTDFSWVKGETRVNSVIVCQEPARQFTVLVDTLDVGATDVSELIAKARRAIESASCVVVGGSLPRGVSPTIYSEILQVCRQERVPSVLDSSGEGLAVGLGASPTVAKPNREELETISGATIASLEDAVGAVKALAARYGVAIVASLGEWGSVAAIEGKTWFVPPVAVKLVNTAGAGDGMTTGLAIALSLGQPLTEGLRLGTAIAAAVIENPGTAECTKEEVERFVPLVSLEPLD